MFFEYSQWLDMVAQIMWPLIRVSSVFLAMPLVGSKLLPMRIRVLFSIVVTYAILPSVPSVPNIDVLSIASLALVIQQIIIGLAIGFILQLTLHAFVIAGQVLAMQSGLGFASLVDPATGASVPLVSQFYLFVASLIFLNMNGHLALIETVSHSFTTLPISTTGISTENLWIICMYLSWVFQQAVLIALPVMFSLLLINLGFGVIARAAPQINIFSIGFPITLTLGLVFIYLTFTTVLAHTETVLVSSFRLIDKIL